jgi:glycosyltransferase involved in cell wall biosynthesis
VEDRCDDPRVRVISHDRNRGVGAAVLSGYRRALTDGAEIIVKLDGDGQMDPSLIPGLVAPIAAGEADYTKGNRFYRPEGIQGMPTLRLIGNAVLSFMTKFSSGYWSIFDPTNGFTAIHARVVEVLPLEKISEGFFFESDLLFRLNTVRAVVVDVPMDARYRAEASNLRISGVIGEFFAKHLRNFAKRIVYGYYLRNFSVASIELGVGLLLTTVGGLVGASSWIEGTRADVPATSGTVMLAALPVLIGFQLLLAFLSYDMQNLPREVLHRRLARRRGGEAAVPPGPADPARRPPSS